MNLLDLIGGTPLVTLETLAAPFREKNIVILAKAEFLNPSGSVKDRAAKSMILDGIKNGKLSEGKAIIDATSGNTGIAYAMIGAALGFRVVLYLPANTSPERKRIISHLGADIVETSPLDGSDGAFLAVRKAAEDEPEKYFYPDQYNNPANPLAHYNSTGPEIWQQTNGEVTHFVSVMGTSGTFTGTSGRLKQYKPSIKVVAVQPNSPFHGIEGVKHMPSTIKPGNYDESLQDELIEIETEDAYHITRRLAAEEGLYVGISSGANVCAALKVADTAPPGSVIVTVLCDNGSRYSDDRFWTSPPPDLEFGWHI